MFNLGQVVMTRGISSLIEKNQIDWVGIYHILNRHVRGGWGDFTRKTKSSTTTPL
ncbi:hypothetical protein Psch_01642 [Pelotomaculum schinkii]|uniref:Uncharacterized protein n=1 Tax=Pelotomaculum schinkii TaxID=78350 RepID=A0A4Y7RIC9_9FIRM|nr:hypothetical protein Psch_01642 [Pelotomaculum schinkii]